MRAGLALIFFALFLVHKTGSTSSTLFLKVSGSGNTGRVAK
jgi:hypothetical protein